MQDGEHDLGRGLALDLGAGADGDAAAVVADLAAAVGQEGDVDAGAVAGHGLVDRVVDHLVDQVVQAARDPWTRCTCPGRLRTASRPSRIVMSLAE